ELVEDLPRFGARLAAERLREEQQADGTRDLLEGVAKLVLVGGSEEGHRSIMAWRVVPAVARLRSQCNGVPATEARALFEEIVERLSRGRRGRRRAAARPGCG